MSILNNKYIVIGVISAMIIISLIIFLIIFFIQKSVKKAGTPKAGTQKAGAPKAGTPKAVIVPVGPSITKSADLVYDSLGLEINGMGCNNDIIKFMLMSNKGLYSNNVSDPNDPRNIQRCNKKMQEYPIPENNEDIYFGQLNLPIGKYSIVFDMVFTDFNSWGNGCQNDICPTTQTWPIYFYIYYNNVSNINIPTPSSTFNLDKDSTGKLLGTTTVQIKGSFNTTDALNEIRIDIGIEGGTYMRIISGSSTVNKFL